MSDISAINDKKQKLRKKYYEEGGKEKARQYYLNNRDVIKEKARTRYQNLSEEQKQAKRDYSKRRYKQMIDAIEHAKNSLIYFFSSINNGCSRNKIR